MHDVTRRKMHMIAKLLNSFYPFLIRNAPPGHTVMVFVIIVSVMAGE